MKKKKTSDPLDQAFEGYFNFLMRFFWKPLQMIAGNPNQTSGAALLLFALRRIVCALLFFAAFGVFVEAMAYFKISREGFLGETFGYLIGVPVMLGLVYFCLDFMRLVLLAICNRRGDEELEGPMRTLVLGLGVIIFFVGMFGMINIQMWFSNQAKERLEKEKFQQEQQEYLSYLKQGRQAWNAYINKTSMHYIDFSGLNLDGFDFTGYDLNLVKFIDSSLKGACFDECYLALTKFDRSDCTGASFKKSYCNMTSFSKTCLQNADFSRAFIRRSALAEADSKNAKLTDLNENFILSPWYSRKQR